MQVQDDLRHLKDQIITTAGGKSVEYIDIRAIEDAINRTEKSIWVCLHFIVTHFLSLCHEMVKTQALKVKINRTI